MGRLYSNSVTACEAKIHSDKSSKIKYKCDLKVDILWSDMG